MRLALCRIATCVLPTNTKFKPLLLQIQAGIRYTNTHKHRTAYFKSTLTLLRAEIQFCRPTKTGNSCYFFIIIIIRECGRTLYAGFNMRFTSTNTKFKPLLLPTQAGIPYTNFYKHRTTYFKSALTFLGLAKR